MCRDARVRRTDVAVLEWEELVVSLTHELPQPVSQETGLDGTTVLVGGDPGEVMVRLTPSCVVVSEFAVRWRGPHEAITSPISFGTVRWRRLDGVPALTILRTLISAARDSRRAKYRACRVCEATRPPEWMREDDVCDRCAEGHFRTGH
jgi:hypothetical protein